jgi:hypothetical protein
VALKEKLTAVKEATTFDKSLSSSFRLNDERMLKIQDDMVVSEYNTDLKRPVRRRIRDSKRNNQTKLSTYLLFLLFLQTKKKKKKMSWS